MSREEKEQLKLSVYNEGMRYLDNAVKTLNEKAKPRGIIYDDKKYVRTAGHQAYCGVLYALDKTGLIKLKSNQRPDVKDYREALAKNNRKMLDYFNHCYKEFHLDYGYDGMGNPRTLKEYMKYAEDLIRWAANKAAA
jgi:hypothetical protein